MISFNDAKRVFLSLPHFTTSSCSRETLDKLAFLVRYFCQDELRHNNEHQVTLDDTRSCLKCHWYHEPNVKCRIGDPTKCNGQYVYCTDLKHKHDEHWVCPNCGSIDIHYHDPGCDSGLSVKWICHSCDVTTFTEPRRAGEKQVTHDGL